MSKKDSSKDNNLERICSHCGQFKPRKSFLQLDEARHVTYGTICADCRKPYSEEQAQLDEEGLSGHSTENKLDAKFVSKNEKEKAKINSEIQENYFEERDEKFLAKERQAEKTKQDNQEQLIKEYKEADKKASFLDTKRATTVLAPEKIPGSEAQKAQEGKVDLQHDVRDTQIAGKLKHQGLGYLSLRTMLSQSSPIGRAAKVAREHAGVAPANANPDSTKDYMNRVWQDNQKKRFGIASEKPLAPAAEPAKPIHPGRKKR